MSQEKTLEKYKNKDWLFEQYIIKNKTIKQISDEFGYSKTTLSRYKDRFMLTKYKKRSSKSKITKKQLYKEYVVLKKLPIKIAEEYGVNRSLIFEKLSKWNIVRSQADEKEARISRIAEISNLKYGGVHFNSTKEVIDKKNKTILNKYGHKSYFRSKAYKEREDRKNTILYGKTAYEWAQEYNITNIIVYRWIYSHKNHTKEEFVNFLKTYEPGITNIENILKNKLSIELHNKYFDLERYPNLRYKPDFKLNNKLAINVDGLYWHSELVKDDKYYHFHMRKAYEDLGLKILQFREDEVNYKLDILESMINNQLFKSKKIHGRKTNICTINQKDADQFLTENHLMGRIKARHIGLKINDKLIMMISYKVSNNILKIERTVSKNNHIVMGGFSKLLKHLEGSLESINEIHYWVDLRYGTGNFLKQIGFIHSHDILGWKWTDLNKTYNRLHCRANMDIRKISQKEHAKELGLVKIYDAGQRLWIKNKPYTYVTGESKCP